MIIEITLLAILGCEGVRLYSLLKNRPGKHGYFRKRLAGVDQSIWDSEFHRHKTQEIKEGLRVELSAVRSKQSDLQKKIKDEEVKPTMSKDELNRLKDDDERMEVKCNKLIWGIGRPKLREDGMVDENETMKLPTETDVYIKGLEKDVQALNEKIASLNELRVMLKDYIKKEV